MGNEKSKEGFVCLSFQIWKFRQFTNIFKALRQRIDTFSDDAVNTIMESMQEIIDEESDRIKDLELRIKTRGSGYKL